VTYARLLRLVRVAGIRARGVLANREALARRLPGVLRAFGYRAGLPALPALSALDGALTGRFEGALVLGALAVVVFLRNNPEVG
jgi:hypothetical protein